MYILAQGIDNDSTSGNGQCVFSRFGHFLGEERQHIVAHIFHISTIGRSRCGVGQYGLAAVFDFAHILWK